MKKKLLSLNLFLILTLSLGAKVFDPAYYASANGKTGEALKTSMYNIIKSPNVTSYDGLISAYEKTDKRSDGKLRDWYSNYTNYSFSQHTGNYKDEGDMWNREHCVPQSWFSKSSPMKSDIVHVIPTDGYVNNRRSSYFFGEVVNPSYTSKNGYSKLGPARSGLGYQGTVFEPNDEIKGDIARIYFYMVTCYQDKCTNWSGNFFTGTTYQPLPSWAYDMFLRWAKEDPVDDVERARNNAVQDVQGNRNPFVDFEGLEQYIWGDHKSVAFSATNYVSPYGGTTPTPDPDPTPDPEPDPTPQPSGNGDYVKVTTAPEDWTGTYLIVYESGKNVLNGALEKIDAENNFITVDIQDNTIADSETMRAAQFTIKRVGDDYVIVNASGKYLGASSSSNTLTLANNQLPHTITLKNDGNEVILLSSYGNQLRYNVSAKRFRYYKSGQMAIQLYKKVEAVVLAGDVNGDGSISIADVTELVNILLERITDYDEKAADVNGDGTVGIADLTSLVNLILGNTTP